MAKPTKSLIERKKDLIDDQDHLSENEKEKLKKKVENTEKNKEEKERGSGESASEKDPIAFRDEDFATKEEELGELDFGEIYEHEYDPPRSAKEEPVFVGDEDIGEENEYPDFGKQFLLTLEEEQARENKENDLIGAKDYKKLLELENKKAEQARSYKEADLPGYRPNEEKYVFGNYNNRKQSLSDSMALKMGVTQEELDKISSEAAKKFGKDIFSEAVDSGVVNIGANIVGGGDLILDRVVGWKNNPLSKPSEYLQKRAAEEEKEMMAAVERTGKGKSAEVSAKVIAGVTEALPELALAMMTAGGSTAVSSTKKAINALAKSSNYLYSAETQLYPIYKEARLSGATEDEALRTALGGAIIGSWLENKLGFEKYVKSNVPMTWKEGLLNYGKASVLEGAEEVINGAVPEAVEMWVFDKDKRLLGAREGEDVVLNLYKACGDFLLGSTVGAVNNTKKLFDISMDAYNRNKGKDKIKVSIDN